MLNQLQKIFLTVITNPNESTQNNDYEWFITNENEVIGIHKEELTDKDTAILQAFLTPYHIGIPLRTAAEQKWKERIQAITPPAGETIQGIYRFVYFSINKNQIEPHVFKEAIHELFAKQVAILWESEQQGVIIEEQRTLEDSISYEQIIDVLMSDLYIKINFFVGPFRNHLENIGKHYNAILTNAAIACTYANKPVTNYIEVIPYILIDQADTDSRVEIRTAILQSFINDEEMLKTIEKFITCNLNVSVTAKALHMHRNSLQYRLDKFNEKTGIDVRQFHHALAIYLALKSE